MSSPRLLYIDVETAPILAYTWGLWDQNIGLNQIVKPWSLMAAAWQWEGGKVQYMDNRAAKDPRDDVALVRKLWQLFDEADLVCTQNGKHFDVRRINARFLELGMNPPSSFRQIDTKVEAKRVAALVSNKLEWLAKAIAGTEKERHKKFPGFELWSEALNGNMAAWREMERYNKQDVRATRAVYLKLRPWIKNHPNVAAFAADDDLHRCPKCGSDDLQARGVAYTTAGRYRRYMCKACGGWSRGKDNLLERSKRRALLAGE